MYFGSPLGLAIKFQFRARHFFLREDNFYCAPSLELTRKLTIYLESMIYKMFSGCCEQSIGLITVGE